jgi:peptide/nickel transport system substrate-binding protein
MFDPLVGADFAGEQISKDSGVAEDWTVSDDGLVYTFTIREGLKFHNGEDLTADDVKFTLDRYLSDEATTSNTAAIRPLIDSITVLSPTEVEVKLTQPKLTFLTLLSDIVDTGSLIIPKDYFQSVGAEGFAQNPVGSGPYKLVERQTGSHITLEQAAPTHFAIGTPRFKRVTLRLVPEESTRVAMLRAGDADFADVGVDKVSALRDEGFRIFEHGGVSVLYVFFQLQRPDDPTQDLNLRRALSHAINREEINQALLEGLGEPTGNVWPSLQGVTPIPPDPFDVEQAKALLAQTPYGPGGTPLDLQMQVTPREGWPAMLVIAQAIQSYWKDIGVASTIIYRDFGAFRNEWLDKSLAAPTAILLNYDAQVDWQSVMTTSWTCDGLLSSVCDPELDALHAAWGQARSMEEYVDLATPVEQRIRDNQYVIPIVAARQYFAGNDQLPEGYQPGLTVRGINIRAMVMTP